jgi:hypothetical protein
MQEQLPGRRKLGQCTTPWQGLFLQSYCISAIHGGQMEDDCRDAGGRATQGAVAELGPRREQRSRSNCRGEMTSAR